MTVSEQVRITKGRSTGFDYMRILLSISVVAWHTIRVCYGSAAEVAYWEGPLRPLVFQIIPCFFALSGFLVAGSLERVNNLPVFLTLRVLRLFPALCCEVVISALIIGPILTKLSVTEYFSRSEFYVYFLNVIGRIHYFLPGVFVQNPTPETNLQLWTIPSELDSYIVLTILSMLTIATRPRLFGIVAIALNVAFFFYDEARGNLIPGFSPTGQIVVACFVWGVFLFIEREKIPYSGLLCSLAAAIAWVAISWKPEAAYLAPLPIAYVTMYLGLQNPRKIALIALGDFSYGIYLYGFPVQQAVSQLLPAYRYWYVNLVLSLVIAGFCAWCSWIFVESRVLARKNVATRFVDRHCNAIASRFAGSGALVWLGKIVGRG